MNTDEKTFTREETEAIVESRLARERRNNEQLLPIRELLHRLRRQEPNRSLSTAALSDLVVRMLDSALKDKSLSSPSRADGAETAGSTKAAAETAADTDSNPEYVLSKAKEPTPNETVPAASESAVSEEGRKPVENGTEARDGAEYHGMTPPEKETAAELTEEEAKRERRRRDIRDFLGEYGEDTLLSALSDDAFRQFCIGKNDTLCGLYRGYLAFLSALTENKNARLCRAAERQLASTGFSNTASGAPDYGAALSENQKSVARSAGMSYRDYAALLEQIPTKRL